MENYLAAKQILFRQSTVSIINIDDDYGGKIASAANDYVTYGKESYGSDYYAKNIVMNESGIRYELVGSGVSNRLRIPALGMFSVYNSLAAAVCALRLAIPFVYVAEALAVFKGVAGRMEIIQGDNCTVIIDYAHTPDGLENVLCTLKEISRGRIVTVFGCGGDRDKTKRPLMGRIVSTLSDEAIVTSDNPRTENPTEIINDILVGMDKTKKNIKIIENRREAIRFAIVNRKKHDIILLAGKGHETYQIIGTAVNHFDEREIVREFMGES
jgi:UDP-N-acetylmuramoyl-L-alanyl-D-glutamate--2,6-diaminopimelate ligase